jgi:DNA-binding transcriptional LysR family regulator
MEARTDQIVERVRRGEADLGVGTFPADEDGVGRTLLIRDRLVVFCSRKSDLAARRKMTWSDLDGYDLITLTRESGIRFLVELGLHAHERQARPAFEVSQVTTAVALVEAGLGIAVLPTLAWATARDRAVVALPLGPPEMTREVVMIHRHDRSLSPAAEAFGAFLRKEGVVLERSFQLRGHGQPATRRGRLPSV